MGRVLGGTVGEALREHTEILLIVRIINENKNVIFSSLRSNLSINIGCPAVVCGYPLNRRCQLQNFFEKANYVLIKTVNSDNSDRTKQNNFH